MPTPFQAFRLPLFVTFAKVLYKAIASKVNCLCVTNHSLYGTKSVKCSPEHITSIM
jgi:hypothetical protein